MTIITEATNLKDIYDFQYTFQTPYFFPMPFEIWEKSFTNDTDGDGRVLFKQLTTKTVYNNKELIGFIQYGNTAFGFNSNGDISSEVSYPVIRNLYFKQEQTEAGKLLLKTALDDLGDSPDVYAFFHYFGMSCFARHGKLFETHKHIDALLKERGFEIEHENVYYSSTLKNKKESPVSITP